MSDHDDRTVLDRVGDALGTGVAASTELDGGEVGRVLRVALDDGRTVVAKTGETPLDVEAYMLTFLGDRGLPVPDLYDRSEDLLVMEYVEGDGRLTPAVERDVARHLAALHEESPRTHDHDSRRTSNDDSSHTNDHDSPRTDDRADGAFGFPRDTLSGPYRQPNPWTDSWVAFYRDHRLLRVAETAREAGALPVDLSDRLTALADDLGQWLPQTPPASLVHGDVWANNLVVRDGAVAAFLDPACYFGHAEVELAYVAFAGFGDQFFDTYEAERAIADGFFEGRREVYQLYPLLEHLLYFRDDRYAETIRGLLDDLGY